MVDIEIHLVNRPGALAEMGEALAAEGVNIEGGGAWVIGELCIAHFLFENAEKAYNALSAAGINVVKVNKILIQRLNQEQPGQMGKLTRLMHKEGINIEVIYSDHYNQLVLVVDNYIKGKKISEAWKRGIEL